MLRSHGKLEYSIAEFAVPCASRNCLKAFSSKGINVSGIRVADVCGAKTFTLLLSSSNPVCAVLRISRKQIQYCLCQLKFLHTQGQG
jgi:hypothetical protein